MKRSPLGIKSFNYKIMLSIFSVVKVFLKAVGFDCQSIFKSGFGLSITFVMDFNWTEQKPY